MNCSEEPGPSLLVVFVVALAAAYLWRRSINSPEHKPADIVTKSRMDTVAISQTN